MRGDPEQSSCNDLGRIAELMVGSRKHVDLDLVCRLIVESVATATVERTFSTMNIIKTELRNKYISHKTVLP